MHRCLQVFVYGTVSIRTRMTMRYHQVINSFSCCTYC